ncbi:MAG: SLC13 family permease [Bacteroidota bacterium]
MEGINFYWPLIVLLIGTISVVLLIVSFRIHAFFALIISAILVGILGLPAIEGIDNAWVNAVENVMVELGKTAGSVSFVIAIAAVLGVALTESGAAERIVDRLMRIFGEKYAGIALLLAGFILSIPVFFDTVFFLLIPLAIALATKLKKNFLFYVMTMGCGAAITHSLVPPTPGPLVMADILSLNLAVSIIAGMLAGFLPAIVGYQYAKRLNVKMLISPPDFVKAENGGQPKELPSFGVSIMPILLPLLLIILGALLNVWYTDIEEKPLLPEAIEFLGNKNIAMLLGLVVALWLWAKQKGLSMKALGEDMQRPLELAGLIILITSAGGAFGAMIRATGIGDMINELSANGFSINLVIVAWLMAAIIKFAQGSSTVAVITTASIMAAILQSAGSLPFHPVYIYLAIGFGSMAFSWMNDSGFWIVVKLSGLKEKQGIRAWTIMLFFVSLAGFLQTLLLSYILPFN